MEKEVNAAQDSELIDEAAETDLADGVSTEISDAEPEVVEIDGDATVQIAEPIPGSTHKHLSEKEKKRRRLKRKIKRLAKRIITPTTLIGVALALLIVAGASYFVKEHQNSSYSEYDAKLNALASKKQQLLSELDRLGPDMEKRLGNTSFMSFVFTSLDEAMYTSAHPVMAETDHDLLGVMALSPTELPGLEGKVTADQFGTLKMLGWGLAIYWDGTGDLTEYIEYMRDEILPGYELDLPKTIIFKEGVYKVEYDEIIIQYGIVNAIHHNEDPSLPVRETTEPTGVWHPGCVGWKAGMSATLLKRQIEAEGGYGFLEINFDNSLENTAYSYFEVEGEKINERYESFRKMVSLFKDSMRNGSIEVLNTENTRAKVEKYYSERTSVELEFSQRREQINVELVEIERQMTALYYEYMQGGK